MDLTKTRIPQQIGVQPFTPQIAQNTQQNLFKGILRQNTLHKKPNSILGNKIELKDLKRGSSSIFKNSSNKITPEKYNQNHHLTKNQIIVQQLRSFNTSPQVPRSEAILQNVINHVIQNINEKDSRINPDFLMKVTQIEAQKALQNQNLTTPKDINDLQNRIFKIISQEDNILYNKSKYITQPYHYLNNTTSPPIFGKDQTQAFQLHSMKQSPFLSHKNSTIKLQSTYQKSFLTAKNSTINLQNVQTATPATTSLWFNDFGVQDNIKSLIKDQNRQEISEFLKYQMRTQQNEQLKNARNDKFYMSQIMNHSREKRNLEKHDQDKRQAHFSQESKQVQKQVQDDAKRLRNQKDLEYMLEHKIIQQNLVEMQNDRMNKLRKKMENINVQEIIKQQREFQQQKLVSQRLQNLTEERDFISHVTQKNIGKAKTLRSGGQISFNNTTLLDQFFLNQSVPNKSYELVKKNEVFQNNILKQIELKEQQKLENEMKLHKKYESEIVLREERKKSQDNLLKKELLREIQENNKQLILDKQKRIQNEQIKDKELKSKLQKSSSKFETELYKQSEILRQNEILNKKLVKEQIKEQTLIRLNESLM